MSINKHISMAGGAGLLVAAMLLTGLPAANAVTITPLPNHNYPVGGYKLPETPVAPHFTPLATSKAFKAQAIPTSVDLTPYAIAPGDQGPVGSCVSWAIGHTMMGWYSSKAGDAKEFAPMYIYSQTHIDSSPDGGGSYVSEALALTEKQGVATAANYPQGDYNFTTLPTDTERAEAAQYKTAGAETLFISNGEEEGVGPEAETVIKEALASGNPVGLGIPIYESFEELDADNYTYDLNDPSTTEDYLGGRYLIALGYDDQGVTVENSWGDNWGNKGFAKLDWNWVNARVNEANYMAGIVKYMPAGTLKAPSIPTFTTEYKSTKEIDISWNKVNSGTGLLDGYKLNITGGGINRSYNLDSDATHHEFTGLKAYANYKITLTASNSGGLASTASADVRTSAKAPTLHTMHEKATKTAVKWTWKTASAGSGHITKYTMVVKYKGKTIASKTVSAKTRSITIKHLKKNHTYSFTFTAYNSAGKHASVKHAAKTKK